jgi:hypothetical protein
VRAQAGSLFGFFFSSARNARAALAPSPHPNSSTYHSQPWATDGTVFFPSLSYVAWPCPLSCVRTRASNMYLRLHFGPRPLRPPELVATQVRIHLVYE